MSRLTYVINLKKAHEKTGLSPYMVAKRIRDRYGVKMAINTVVKYASSNNVEQRRLDDVVAILCDFYGVDFHEAVKVKKSPEMQTPLVAIPAT